jgi:3-dehydroquinate synthase
VRIGRGLLRRARLPADAPVLTDAGVAATPFYRRLRRILRGPALVLSAGERSKSLRSAERLYRWLAHRRVERGDTLVAVGGGMITDLGGFVAATYLRGIPLVLVPTTLLAQVDAAVGGKTGVNLPEGKNLVGTFTPPRHVWIDPESLATLPPRQLRGGMAEVIKGAVIADAALFGLLERRAPAILRRDPVLLERVIGRSVGIKAAVVARDEREAGPRALLNYGHTIGHALEAAGGYRRLTHGEAVAIGMEAEARLAVRLGLLAPAAAERQGALLEAFGLPRRARGLDRPAVWARLLADKKVRAGTIRFALPDRIGHARFPVTPPLDLLKRALDHVLR